MKGKYGNLDSSCVSYGPCQTPTLGFCVERHDRIQSFKPETYWSLDVQIKCPNDGPYIKLDWERVRMFDLSVANLYVDVVKGHSIAVVSSVKSKTKTKQRPQALNTVEMLRVASASLNMGPHQTMQSAENLYINGFISYPRTETTHYAENFDFHGPVSALSKNPVWAAYASNLLKQGIKTPRKGSDAGDHPPITPMRNAFQSEIGNHDHWRLYEYIVKHFLATISPDCTFTQTEVKFEIAGEQFTCTTRTPLDSGFTEIMPWLAIDDGQTAPKLKEGDRCTVEQVKLGEHKTCAPDYLTESELITLMEQHGIGTDASIPTHINNIGQRNYVTVISGRRLQPTNLGIMLVHGYGRIDRDLSLPTIRSEVEKQLNLISQGKARFEDVLKHAVAMFEQKFLYFVENVCAMDKLFEITFTPLSESGKPMSRCGKCRRFMKYVATAPPRLYCNTCDETYDLPNKTNVKLYKELKCPLDDFELLLCSTGSDGKCYALCPYCYNHPPFNDMKTHTGCNGCTHPGCQHSLTTLGVSPCETCEEGVLVLDPTSAPKWKLACNNTRCTTVVTLFKHAHRITVSSEVCEECGRYQLDVIFHKDKTPLENGETKRTGCIYCDEVFSKVVSLKKARLTVKSSRRGRGGRGRGRGRRQPKDKMSQLANYFL